MDTRFIENISTHHSFLVYGGENEKKEIISILHAKKIKYITLTFDRLTIKDTRNLQKEFSEGKDEVVYVIDFLSIEHEASNALLKVLEEPRLGIHFIFIAFPSISFPKTVLSRFYVIENKNFNSVYTTLGAEFPFLNIQQRKKQIDTLLEMHDEIDSHRSLIGMFLKSVIETVSNNDVTANKDFLEKALKNEKIIYERGSMVKIILEWFMLQTPFIKR